MATIISPYTRPQTATVRPNVFSAAEPDRDRPVNLEQIPVTLSKANLRTRLIEEIILEATEERIEEANIIVSAGRGCQDPANLDTVRELARNSDLANLAGGLLELTVEPQHENLKAERLVQGLQQALSEQADLQVQIRVVVAESGEIDTVAKRMSEAERQRQREAEAVIAEDPTVRALQNEFGATIESISPR